MVRDETDETTVKNLSHVSRMRVCIRLAPAPSPERTSKRERTRLRVSERGLERATERGGARDGACVRESEYAEGRKGGRERQRPKERARETERAVSLSHSLLSVLSLARALSLFLSLSLSALSLWMPTSEMWSRSCLCLSLSSCIPLARPLSFCFSLSLSLPSLTLTLPLSFTPSLGLRVFLTPSRYALPPFFHLSSLAEPTPFTPLHPSSPLSVQGLNASIPWRASTIPGMQGRYPRRLFRAWQCRARAGGTGGVLQLGHHVNCLWRCSGLALQ